MAAAAPVRAMGMFVSLLHATGASAATLNNMYTAVARRAQKIAMARIPGFTRGAILSAFLAGALLGGAAGCLLVLPLQDSSSAIGDSVTFSQFVFRFRFTPAMFAAGMLFAACTGLPGGLFPAWAAARPDLLSALKS